MPFYEESYENTARLASHLKSSPLTESPVYSAGGGYNPTNLAVRKSLQDIFDEFTTMVSYELRMIENDTEEDEP